MPSRPVLTLGHSPDPDDAFMWWPLVRRGNAPPRLETGRFEFRTVAEDIEALNRRAEDGTLDITAISCAQYPRVAETYTLTACGASVGDGYGPKLVAPRAMTPDQLVDGDPLVAVPGERTTAFLVATLLLGKGRFRARAMPFDQIEDVVLSGECDAGVVIHESQLTYADRGLHLITDLGAWWTERTGGPLPLGANVIRRDLDDRFGPGTLTEVTTLLAASVQYALDHRAESVEWAMQFARGADAAIADRFVEMYVNHWTLDYGPAGRAAVRRLLDDAAAAGLAPAVRDVDFVAVDAA